MTPQAALIEILERLGAGNGGAVLVTDAELSQWPNAAVAALKSQGLLEKARPATSAICPGCERACVMPVQTPPSTTRIPAPFIVCDKRSDINRVAVPIARLNQWRCGTDAVRRFVSASLGLHPNDQKSASADLWNIGIATGDKRSQMLCLQADGILNVAAGNNAVLLADLIGFHDGAYSLDAVMIRQLVDASTTADHRYTPTNARREARKLDTQEQYLVWQRACRALKRKHPGMSDVWYSQQIAKTDNPQGRDAETIRKHMKK